MALLALRNEAPHVRRALCSYIEQGIDVIVLDHGSTDDTVARCESFLGSGLLRIEHIPWNGEFNLTAQLEAKARLMDELPHEWIIHADADEWLQSSHPSESLLHGISRLSSQGYNAINFEEFVFLPLPERQQIPPFYEQEFLYYYFFAPKEVRLVRAWRRLDNLSNIRTGGHRLTGGAVRLASEFFNLRHYIVLSRHHARQKYVGKVFAEEEIKKGWHHNRLAIVKEDLCFPQLQELQKLAQWDSVDFDRSRRHTSHFWQW